jgi:hypothetical protein
MQGTLRKSAEQAREIDRSEVRITEETFGAGVSDVAKLLWPKRTAAHVASLAGCSVRNVEFYLSGEQKWSGDALAVIVEEICRRNRMRNVRVTARR